MLKTYIWFGFGTILLKIPPKISQGLSGVIPEGISVTDFNAVTKLSMADSETILNFIVENNIGKKENDKFFFESGDKLQLGLFLINQGFPVDEISINLTWRDFEGLTAEILSHNDFAVIKNMMLTKPRMEIDVVGIKLGIAILIDCKHWKQYGSSALKTAVMKQIERTKKYVEKTEGSIAVPVIVTLYKDKIDFIDGVPIVPIFQFNSFVDEFYGNLDLMKTIEKD